MNPTVDVSECKSDLEIKYMISKSFYDRLSDDDTRPVELVNFRGSNLEKYENFLTGKYLFVDDKISPSIEVWQRMISALDTELIYQKNNVPSGKLVAELRAMMPTTTNVSSNAFDISDYLRIEYDKIRLGKYVDYNGLLNIANAHDVITYSRDRFKGETVVFCIGKIFFGLVSMPEFHARIDLGDAELTTLRVNIAAEFSMYAGSIYSMLYRLEYMRNNIDKLSTLLKEPSSGAIYKIDPKSKDLGAYVIKVFGVDAKSLAIAFKSDFISCHALEIADGNLYVKNAQGVRLFRFLPITRCIEDPKYASFLTMENLARLCEVSRNFVGIDSKTHCSVTNTMLMEVLANGNLMFCKIGGLYKMDKKDDLASKSHNATAICSTNMRALNQHIDMTMEIPWSSLVCMAEEDIFVDKADGYHGCYPLDVLPYSSRAGALFADRTNDAQAYSCLCEVFRYKGAVNAGYWTWFGVSQLSVDNAPLHKIGLADIKGDFYTLPTEE